MIAATFAILAAVADPAISRLQAEGREQLAAIKTVEECLASVSTGRCDGAWKGLSFTLYSDGSGSLMLPAGGKWSYYCRQDRVETYTSCTLSQNGFSIIMIRGQDGLATWGGDRYPRSEKIAKFGNGEPIRFPEKTIIQGEILENMINLMKVTPSAIFRWYDWPYNAPRDIDVDLTQFSDVIQIFHAMEFKYRINHPIGE